jgi:hypothetical protein
MILGDVKSSIPGQCRLINILSKINSNMLILNGSDYGVQHLGLLGFWTLSIIWYSEDYKRTQRSESGSVSVLG